MNYISLYKLNDIFLHQDFESVEEWEKFLFDENVSWGILFDKNGRELRKYWVGYPMQICHDIGPMQNRPRLGDNREEIEAFLPKGWWKFWEWMDKKGYPRKP